MRYEIKANVTPEIREIMTEQDREIAASYSMRDYPKVEGAVAAAKRAYPRVWKFLEINILPLDRGEGGAYKPANDTKFIYAN